MQLILGAAILTVASAQLRSEQQYTTPVPILKQINRHNEDGSYSYGYEGADGSFKIETKFPDGQVRGKYGYVDDTGKVREVEYGASKRGFEVAGTGINVPPPTLVNNNNIDPNSPDYDDGQYREDPSIYYKADPLSTPTSGPRYNNPPAAPVRSQSRPQRPLPAQVTRFFSQNPVGSAAPPPPAPLPLAQPAPAQQQYYSTPQQYQFSSPPASQYNGPSSYNPQAYNNPAPYSNPAPYRYDPRQFAGHPATNIDILSGSYSVSYSG